jgi:hypothetical protein
MKTLTLQITKDNFFAILNGTQKQEERNIYPNTVKRYLVDPDKDDITPIIYDALYLINGRQKQAPRLKVAVAGVEIYIETDENDVDLTYVENGIEYLVAVMRYNLGDILDKENC